MVSPAFFLSFRYSLTSADVYRVLYSYLKPESARVHPEATVRPWSTLEIDGDAMAFASALGYM